MWSRAKEALHHCINVLLVLVIVGLCTVYVGVNSILIAAVINDLRVDTYVTIDTGFAIVMLILLLGWSPVWLMRNLRDRR